MISQATLPTKQELDAIDFSWVQKAFIECPERSFVDAPAGVEHYRLLYWLSINGHFVTAVELGTYMGFGAYCLAANPETKVFTYDINISPVKWLTRPANVQRMVINNNEDAFPDSITGFDLIFVDTWHNGIMEMAVFEYLHMRKWKGILIFDDIFYNKAMRLFWDDMLNIGDFDDDIEVINATDIGHATGTGIIIFK